MSKNLLNGDIEFDSPAARIVKQFSEDTKEQFRIPVNLPDLSFLRALSVQGRLIYQTGSVANDAADIITITPSNGSTLFVYRIIFSSFATVATFTSKNNGITRILVTLLYEMKKRKCKLGLATLCIGGGQGIATIIER